MNLARDISRRLRNMNKQFARMRDAFSKID
jgi:hypothetical protein